MKTYLFDTFNRYKRFSEELDAKTILCNKSWWVFNDSGEKEVYIFNTDGTLIIAVSGKVTNATWQYITANKSLIITGNNQSYMVHPAFFDNQIFALQVDGTNDYAFLIDENNLPSTNLRSLADLKEHFAEKERQEILAEEQKRQAELAAFMHKQYEEELERQRLAKEAEEKRIRAEKEREKWRIIGDLKNQHPFILFIYQKLGIILYSMTGIAPFGCAIIWEVFWDEKMPFKLMLKIFLFMVFLLFIYGGIVGKDGEKKWEEKLYKKYLKENQKD